MEQLKKLKGKQLFDYLTANKSLIIAQKKSAMKEADAFSFSKQFINSEGELVEKSIANTKVLDDVNSLKISVVINTTNYKDSHDDVHIPGLWKKSLSQNKSLFLLQEHKMKFENIITDGDSINAYTKTMSWKELGQEYKGNSEALVFDCIISKDRNEFMFNQYKNGYVKNHSVGMQYVTVHLCINDEYYKEEYANWLKYYSQIVNPIEADEYGYFFAVTEAKVIEGSAVVIGSNAITPTLNNNVKSNSTLIQPVETTEKEPQKFDLQEAIKKTKIIH